MNAVVRVETTESFLRHQVVMALPVFIASGATILVQSHSSLRRKNYPDCAMSSYLCACGSRGIEYTFKTRHHS